MSDAQDSINKIACHECDLLLEEPQLQAGQKAVCPRCGFLISALPHNAHNRLLAYSSSALVFLLAANAFPFLAFQSRGQEQMMNLAQSVTELFRQGYPELAVLILLFIILIPAVFLLGVIYLVLPLKLGYRLPAAYRLCRYLLTLSSWSMAEVFMIGVLVSLIKIAGMAEVVLGLSFWAYILFAIALTAVFSALDRHQLWRWLEQARSIG